MDGSLSIRPMRLDDAKHVHKIPVAAFADLKRRSGGTTPSPDSPFSEALARTQHLLEHDAGGCWVGELAGEVVGVAMAVRRGGLWGLSLLAVQPEHQSSGIGSRLLRSAHDYAPDATGRLILASSDARALRAYSRLGLSLSPVATAHGKPRDVEQSPLVREGGDADLALAAEVDTEVRGAPHGPDLGAMLGTGTDLLVHPGRGYAFATGSDLRLLAARDAEAAADLLRTVLARGGDARVLWMTSDQQWAIAVSVQAGLELDLGFGAVMRSGESGSQRNYLPNGAYL